MKKVLLACVMASLASCREPREAGIMVVIPTDLAVPQDVDGFRIRVVHATRGEALRQDFTLSGRERIPFTYGVGPSKDKLPGPYTFQVIGLLHGKTKTLREAVTDVPRDEVRELPMPIEFLCYDRVRTLDTGEVIGSCPAGETCIAGECKPIPTYKPEELPTYSKPMPAADAGPACFDVGACFASPTWLSPDPATCRVARPAGAQNFTLGLLLPPDSPGLTFRDKKLVVFDIDGMGAWREAGAEIQLPTGVCKILSSVPGAMALASTTCPSKRSTLPACKVSSEVGDASWPTDAVADVSDADVLGDALADGDASDAGLDAPDAELRECPRLGDRRCLGKLAQTCSADGRWATDDVCLGGCEAGICTDLCTPGQAQCKADGKTLQTCDATAQYVDTEVCQFACLRGTCMECSPGTSSCEGTTPRTCSAGGVWVKSVACPVACLNGTCAACTPPMRRCQGKTPETCTAAGTWLAEAPCSYACVEATGTCEPDNVVCWGDNTNGESTPKGGTFRSVSAGWGHTCGLRTDGTVDCWGLNSEGQATPKEGTFSAVSAGGVHTCGLRPDGTVDCWGFNYWGQSAPRIGTYLSISAGGQHNCGVRSNGSLDCWGMAYDSLSKLPEGTFVSVSAAFNYNCGLRSDNTVACWGYNTHGEATPNAGIFTSVAAGGATTCGVRANGTVECWGYKEDGRATPKPGTFVSVSRDSHHTCGVRTNGTVDCWGPNERGGATPPSGIFESVSVGYYHTCGVLKSNQ